MITADQARELGKVDPVTTKLAMLAIEQDVKKAAATTNTVLHIGPASVGFAHGQTPSASALMHRAKELLEKEGYKVSFEIGQESSCLGSSHRQYGLRISW